MVERRNTHDDPPPHTSCEAPFCCDCECRTCKRIWEEAGRPGRNEVLVQEATVAKNIEAGQRRKLEDHHAELRLDAARQSLALALARIKELEGGIVAENRRTSEIEQEQVETAALFKEYQIEGDETLRDVVERLVNATDAAVRLAEAASQKLGQAIDVAEGASRLSRELHDEQQATRGEEVAELEAVRDLLISRDEDFHPDGAATVAEVVERILGERDAAKKKIEGLEHTESRLVLTRAELAKLRAAASSFLWEYRKWVPMSSRSSSRMTAAEQKLDEVILVTDGSRSVVCETCGGDLRYVGSQRGCRCPFTSSVPEPVAPNCIRCEGTGKVGPKNEYPCPDCLTRPSRPSDSVSRAELVAACRRAAPLAEFVGPGASDVRAVFEALAKELEKS